MAKKTIEIDEDEYNRDQKVRAIVQQIAANPSARKLMEQAHKLVDPTVQTPTVDAETKANEPLEALRKEFSDYRKSVEDKEAKATEEANKTRLNSDFEAGRAWMRGQKYTPEGIEAVEKMMAEKGILDHKIAVAYWEKEHPTPPPAMPGGTGSWNFLEVAEEAKGDAFVDKLMKSRGDGGGSIAEGMARQVLNEIRSVRR